MTPELLEDLLRELPVPDSADGRERAVAAARARIEARPASERSARRPWRRALRIACVTALLAGALLTPPGRAASGWVGELVGIGEVGGRPTQEHRGFDEAGEAIVINNGTAPDGSRYEWVAYPCKVDLRDEGLPTRFEGFGLSFEWPGVKGHQGSGNCEEGGGLDSERPFAAFGVHIVPSQFKGVPEPDLVVSGATGPRVHGVRVFYTDASGARHELDVDFERMDSRLRAVVTDGAAVGGSYAAFVPGEWAARDEVESRLDLRALQGTGELKLGPIARRERRQAARARDRCAPKEPDLTRLDPDDPAAQARAFAPYDACLDELMPPSPIEVVAYDERGRELARQAEPLMIPAPAGALKVGRPAQRPTDPDAAGQPVVLATGRAPDGARYEFFVERFARAGGGVYGRCLSFWWPDPGAPGSGHCGPELPPSTAFGRRHPERVAAKPFGVLHPGGPVTKHLMLSGFAHLGVSRVRVLYADERGVRDAPVELTRVDGELRRRIAASRPFGFFVSFLPRAALSGPIEVVAYDDAGRELSRVRHRDPLLD
jgi:hypothetical protein